MQCQKSPENSCVREEEDLKQGPKACQAEDMPFTQCLQFVIKNGST